MLSLLSLLFELCSWILINSGDVVQPVKFDNSILPVSFQLLLKEG